MYPEGVLRVGPVGVVNPAGTLCGGSIFTEGLLRLAPV